MTLPDRGWWMGKPGHTDIMQVVMLETGRDWVERGFSLATYIVLEFLTGAASVLAVELGVMMGKEQHG